MHLSHSRDVFDLPFEMNMSLLLACRTIYQEASSVLYSSTSFQFSTPWSTAKERNRCYDTLMCFGARLSEPNRASTQKIEMDFPEIEPRRAADGRRDFLAKARDGLKTLKTFPALRSLKLHLSQDILSWDILLLNRIQLTLPSTCQVLVEFGEIKSYRLHCSFEYRSVRISDEAIWQMTEFLGWKVYGNREVVGEGHEFSDASRWVKCLEQSRLHQREAAGL
ncbi:MAG: hypothetical protein L6R36_004278 [Xanthoria steineri]|nr:MAG: hypothetical protein L6R36_004278 [Xanthoria steineri]